MCYFELLRKASYIDFNFIDKHINTIKSTQIFWLREFNRFWSSLLFKKGTSLSKIVDYKNSGTHFVCVFRGPPVIIKYIWWPTHIGKNYFETPQHFLPPQQIFSDLSLHLLFSIRTEQLEAYYALYL